jgi:shikimate kinase
MKIFLIGMPGSGKSTIGRQIANELSMAFVDLDQEIEIQEGRLIKDIFSTNGEGYFRQVESNVLNLWCDSQKDFVLATGGGAPCFHNGIEAINKSGLSIFLDVPVQELVRRVEKNFDRPLLAVSDDGEASKIQLQQKLEGIRNNRLQYYMQAAIRIENPTYQHVIKAIKK